MYNRLISIVHKNSILLEAQNGFRKMLSTEIASQTFTESIQEALDQHLHVVGIFFDLTKPYNVLNCNTLLDYLDSHGIRRNMNLYTFLFRNIAHWVPQSSILGPLLFSLHTNSIPLNIQRVSSLICR